MKIYRIRDYAADVFGPLMSERTDTAATRMFRNMLANPESQLAKFPDDYALVQVGIDNEDTGEIDRVPHRKICEARALTDNPEAMNDEFTHPNGAYTPDGAHS